MNKNVVIVFLITVGALIAFSVARCEDPVRQAVEASLYAVVGAVEAGDSELLSELIAADYTDRLGHDHRSVVRRILAEVEHIPDVQIELSHLSIQVEESTGYAIATFLPEFHGDVDMKKKRRPKYEFHKGKRLLVRFRRHGERWLVVRGDMTMSISGAL